MGWVIGIDQSASQKSKANKIGWAIYNSDGLFKVGEIMPHFPHFDEEREWLRETIVMISARLEYPYDDVSIGLETVYFNNKFCNPEMFKNLVSIKEHCHVVARDMGCEYFEITPTESFHALSGRGRNTKGMRKEEIVAAFKDKYGEDVSDHVADAAGIAEAIIIRKQKEHSK